MKLLKVQSIAEVNTRLIEEFKKIVKCEERYLLDSYGYIVSKNIISQTCVPEFNKSRVDGYAVRFSNCKIASESSPCMLNLIGSLNIGEKNTKLLGENECMYVPTGGMLPENADAMVMIEDTEKMTDDIVLIKKSVIQNQFITFVGDDIKKDEIVVKKGTKIDERHMGILASIGIDKIKVFSKLKTFILSSGDELVEGVKSIEIGQTREINSIFCSNLLNEIGFDIIDTKLIKDDKELYLKTLNEIVDKNHVDIIITSGGSSKGDKDFTSIVFDELTKNVFCEGISVKPGKPTIIAENENRLFIGLPGHPVSSYLVLKHIIVTAYYDAVGYKDTKKVYGKLVHNIANSNGRANIILCSIKYIEGDVFVEPIYYSSTNIRAVGVADGYFVIDENTEGFDKGRKVEVNLF